MSSKGGRITIKNRFAEVNKHKVVMPIPLYVEKMEERRNFPARIICGVMEVCLHGHWVSKKEFDELYPMPIINSFNADPHNIDGTTNWML